MKNVYSIIFFSLTLITVHAQSGAIKGRVTGNAEPLGYASVTIAGNRLGATADNKGFYEIKNIPSGTFTLIFTCLGFDRQSKPVTVRAGEQAIVNSDLYETTSKLNEVVVTGVSRATEMRSNPVPVAVITKKEMGLHINNNIIDAIINGVPGVSAVTTGPNISKPFIRGLGYNRVLTLYDGIRQEGQQWGDEHGIEVDQYGIERVEVIKGPASLTYGSDALAGVINLIPYLYNGAEGKINGEVTTEYHTNNGMAALSAGLQYAKNGWKYAFRTTGKMAHSFRNAADGPVYNTAFREHNIAAMVRTDKSWGYTAFAATLYNNQQEIPDGSRDSLSRRFTRQQQEADKDIITNRPVVTPAALTSYAINTLHQHIQHFRVYNRSQVTAGRGNIMSLLGFQQSRRREYNHPAFPRQPGLFVVLNTVNYDVKYTLPLASALETTLGVNGMYQHNRSRNATNFPIPDHTLFDIGAFLFAKKSFGRLDVSGGLRYDHRRIAWKDIFVGPNPRNGFERQVQLPDTAGAHLQFPAFRHTYEGFSGSIGIAYNLSDHLLLKANISRGYRAPNITETGSNGLDPGAHIVYLGNRGFVPECNLQQDLGIIAYGKDADVSMEIFHNKVAHYIYQARLTDANGNPVVIVAGNSTYQYQQSAARLYGAELSVNLHPHNLKWLAANSSLAYVEGRNSRMVVQHLGNAARYLPFIPPLHIRSDAKATLPGSAGAFTRMYVRLEADRYAAQPHFYGLDGTETFTAGYTLFNAGAGTTVKAASGRPLLNFFLQVDNIFNTVYQSHLNRLKYFEYYTASPDCRSGIYNMGRNISGKITVPF